MANINLSGSISATGISILGYANISYTSDANKTLTVTEYTNNFLNVTSTTSLTTTRELVLPLFVGQSYVVKNNTSGGQSLLVKGATGTGVTIPNGSFASVISDGTNYVLTSTSTLVTLAGDVTGPASSNTVVKINGTSVPATPNSNQVLVATSGTTSVWSQIYDGYVASDAAIAGTKISPNFGSQNVVTTGTLNSGAITAPSLDTSGVLNLGITNATGVLIGKLGATTTIAGNLTVAGTTTIIDSTTVDVADRIIHVNHSSGIVPPPNQITGIAVHRGSADGYVDRDHPGFFWDETNTTWKVAYNTGGDDITLGSYLPVEMSGLKLTSLSTGIAHINASGVVSSSLIVNADVDGYAAIAGTKISPNFGSQNIVTTGSGTVNSLKISSLSTGIAHVDSLGNVSSSLIVNADVDGYAAIAGTKISPDFGSQSIVTTGPLNVGAATSTSLSTSLVSLAGQLLLTPIYNPATSAAASGTIYFDGYTNKFKVSENTGAYVDLVPTSLPPSGSAGGDLTGTYPNPTVAKINGTSVNATPSSDQVLVATSGTTSIWSQIFDGYVAANAAIAGTKISPNFGSQNVVTTGSVNAGSVTTPTLDYSGTLNIGPTNATSVVLSAGGANALNIGTSKVNTLIGQRVKTTAVAANYTVQLTDYVLSVNTSAGSYTITMPSTRSTGDIYLVKDISGNCNANNIIIQGNGGDLVDGASSLTLDVDYSSVGVYWNGSAWSVI